MQEALDFLNAHRNVAFATIGTNGHPMLRIFQIMKIDGHTLYFATNIRKNVYQELQVNPAMDLDPFRK